MARKRNKQLRRLMELPFFTAAKARTLGISPNLIAYHCKKGDIIRLSRGVYQSKNAETGLPVEWEDLVITVLSIPKGVVCLVSAIILHGLSEELVQRKFWIAVPYNSWPPRRKNAKILRMRNMSLGLSNTKIGNVQIRVFDRERTVVDAFRYLNRETAIKTLQSYLETSGSQKPDLPKLARYQKKLRMNLEPYILALTT